MNKPSTAIVVVGYNRPKSLARLLKSIGRANYLDSNIELLISIDFAENNELVNEVAKDFIWNYGNKKIILHQENLGLRNHVLKCGDFTNEYESIIMLEDDLFVSPNFYIYAIEALEFSKNKSYIGGISLYNHPLNVHTNEVFNPIQDGFDNYYFQFASSWGQAWTKTQWNAFKKWYSNNKTIVPSPEIPVNVTNWSEKSWLKYFTVYLIRTNTYFLYPKVSLSTNFSDEGTHVGSDTTSYQSILNYSKKDSFNFSLVQESESVYDSFYENTSLYQVLNLKKEEVSIDLYGYKSKSYQQFMLSSQLLNYKIIASYGRSLKPIDMNIQENINGKDLFLYDTNVQTSNRNKADKYRKISYNIRHLSFKNSLLVTCKLLALKIKGKFGIS